MLWYSCIRLLYIPTDPKGESASVSQNMRKIAVLEKDLFFCKQRRETRKTHNIQCVKTLKNHAFRARILLKALNFAVLNFQKVCIVNNVVRHTLSLSHF